MMAHRWRDASGWCLDMATIIYAIVGYFALLLAVRILSRRPGGQLTLFEFVIIFLIGGVAIAATVGRDTSVTNCATAILTIGALHRILSATKARFPRFARILDGTPLVLLKDGQWRLDVMRGMRVDPEDVMAAARSKQVASV